MSPVDTAFPLSYSLVMDTETVSVKIGKDAYERVKALAEADYGRSIRSTIELLLDDALARRVVISLSATTEPGIR